MTPSAWLIAGLGNPGPRYDRTPHNLGYEAVNTLVRRHGLNWQDMRKFSSFVAGGNAGDMKLYFMKPVTYMNLSGGAIQPFLDFYKIPPTRLIVVCDDVALPYGRIRLRENGSHGGHNGLRSVHERLGTGDYLRLRIGCAPTRPVNDLAAYVLSPIWGDNVSIADSSVVAAADCIESVLTDGPAKAMSIWNAWKIE